MAQTFRVYVSIERHDPDNPAAEYQIIEEYQLEICKN